MKRKPTISSLPTSGLFIILEQYDKELIQLKQKQKKNECFLPDLCKRICEIEDTIYFIKKVLISRYLEDNTSINKIAKLFLNENGIKANVYEEIFVSKVLNGSKIILETKVLENVINKLSIENLIKISCCKEDLLIKNLSKNYVTEEYTTQELSKAIKNLELEDIWTDSEKNENDKLYKLTRESINERLYNISKEVEEELIEKIKMDEKEGNKNGKCKRK